MSEQLLTKLKEIEDLGKKYTLYAEIIFTLQLLAIIENSKITYEDFLKDVLANLEKYKFKTNFYINNAI